MRLIIKMTVFNSDKQSYWGIFKEMKNKLNKPEQGNTMISSKKRACILGETN